MISIVVPVYNNEKFLDKCVESILHQTFQDWELILVNDGSQDFSAKICNEFVHKDKRIKVIHKSNGGVSSARNAGIERATGEYIMFVDSDDWIEPNLCDSLLSGAHGCDLAIGGYTALRVNSLEKHVADKCIILFPKEFSGVFSKLYECNLLNTPCSKLYKRDIIMKQRFDVNARLGEDFLFNLIYIEHCKTISIIPTSGYIYNMKNENSATKKIREGDFSSMVHLYIVGKKFVERYGFMESGNCVLEKRLYLNVIFLFQILIDSDFTEREKLKMADELLSSQEFKRACAANFRLPLKYEIPRQFFINGNLTGLRIFFSMKKIIKKFVNPLTRL